MSAPSRRPEIRRRQTRQAKIRKLRSRYTQTSSDADRRKIFEKVKVLSPQMTLEQFTKTTGSQA
jgi:hypothetical protein